MNPYMAYEAITTKISFKKGLLQDKEMQNRIFNSKSIDEVVEHLIDKFSFEKSVEELEKENINRDDFETILSKYKVKEIEDLLHYFSGPYKEFIQTMLMEYDIADLSLIIRKLVNKGRMDNISERMIHSDKFATLDFDSLIKKSNLASLIEGLKGTSYYYSLRNVTNEDFLTRQFHIEMKLEILFYRTLFKRARFLEEKDEDVVKNILGTKIDLLNIQWIYRAKKFFNIPPEEILIYCLPNGKRVGYNRLKSLCYTKTLPELIDLSSKYIRHNIFKSDDEFDIAKNIDVYMYRYITKNKFGNTIGVAIAYIYLVDALVRDLTTIAEAVKYEMPKEDLKKYLIHVV